MYLEHFHLNKSPFLEKPDSQIFFPQADREKIIQSLLADIKANKSIIKLIGAEGSGKTLLCKLLSAHVLADYDIVYLKSPLGSFDDLLQIICLDLGMEAKTDLQVNIIEELNNQLALRKAKKRAVVIVIDEAEKLFLATLERLIKVICDKESEVILQLLLAGRPGLNTNLNQLTVHCSNVDINAGYFLQPLSREETGDYLNFRLKASGLIDPEKKEIFSNGAIKKIYETAKGNIRLTNILAEEALQNSCSEKSFLVLLEHVSSKSEEMSSEITLTPAPKKVSPRKIIRKVKSSNLIDYSKINDFLFKYKRQLGGCFIVFIAFVFIIILSGDNEKPEDTGLISDKSASQFKYVEKLAKGDLKPPPLPEKKLIPEKETKSESPVLQANDDVSVNFDEKVEDNKTVDNSLRNAEKIYQDRLRSSAGWLAKAYRGGTTIQLMKLTSQQGEENLKKMLIKDDYYSIKDNLFILKKRTSPPTIFVFYGSFDSQKAARDYRNSMPLFLRKHHPYALLISDALKKIED